MKTLSSKISTKPFTPLTTSLQKSIELWAYKFSVDRLMPSIPIWSPEVSTGDEMDSDWNRGRIAAVNDVMEMFGYLEDLSEIGLGELEKVMLDEIKKYRAFILKLNNRFLSQDDAYFQVCNSINSNIMFTRPTGYRNKFGIGRPTYFLRQKEFASAMNYIIIKYFKNSVKKIPASIFNLKEIAQQMVNSGVIDLTKAQLQLINNNKVKISGLDKTGLLNISQDPQNLGQIVFIQELNGIRASKPSDIVLETVNWERVIDWEKVANWQKATNWHTLNWQNEIDWNKEATKKLLKDKESKAYRINDAKNFITKFYGNIVKAVMTSSLSHINEIHDALDLTEMVNCLEAKLAIMCIKK